MTYVFQSDVANGAGHRNSIPQQLSNITANMQAKLATSQFTTYFLHDWSLHVDQSSTQLKYNTSPRSIVRGDMR